jgi:hypothetical protein
VPGSNTQRQKPYCVRVTVAPPAPDGGTQPMPMATLRPTRDGPIGVATRFRAETVSMGRPVEVVSRRPTGRLPMLDVEDPQEVMGRRGLYRRFSRMSETLIEAANRVWYATLKEG